MNQHDGIYRVAEPKDLPEIVALLADDQLGNNRETIGNEVHQDYLAAFDEIQSDPNNEIIVATASGSVIATLQITYIPNLTHRGTRRAMIEGVRVSSTYRGAGVGTQLMKWVVRRCRSRGCRLVQLTSDLTRTDAVAFYGNLGFQHSHAGMKLWLE